MKHTKKFASLLLALVMLFAMAIPALADENTTDAPKGTITINHAVEGQTYSIYKMFELESYNTETKAYSYKVVDKWKAFVKTGAGRDYFTVDEQDYVTVKNNVNSAALAKAALAYAKGQTPLIEATATEKATTDKTTVKFEDLGLGYYLIDSSLGALCGLTTTQPNAELNEKNSEPTVEKEVQDGTNWGKTNTASIGDSVDFKTTITVGTGAQNYVLHDKMSEGLTLTPDSITVTVSNQKVDADNYTLVENITDDCTFEIRFTDDYVAGLTANTQIVVTYSATLNEKAVIAGTGNTNETMLDYGDENTTTDKTTTYTYQFDLVKTKSDDTVLNGAKFKLYDDEKNGNEIKLVKDEDDTYRVAVTDEEKAAAVEIEAGRVTIKGLGNGTYYLEETEAPKGYNKLTERQKFTIDNANLDATMTTDNADKYEQGGVQVINQTGPEMPSTGGIGTTIFYVAGGVLLVVAGVLLVVRKRMNSSKEAE